MKGKMATNRYVAMDHTGSAYGLKKASALKEEGCSSQKDFRFRIVGQRQSGSSSSIELTGLLKCGSLVTLPLEPHGVDQPDPDIGQGTDSNRMAFALLPLALIILQGPGFTLGCLPSELMQSIAQRFHTGVSSMNPAIGATLKDHWRGASQSLQARCIRIALPVITDFRRASEEPGACRNAPGSQ